MEQEKLSKAVQQALEVGFSQAGILDANTLRPLDEVRNMCAADRCGMYGHCWTCPPGCGSIAENTAAIRKYDVGIIVQTTRSMEDDFDYETMEACSAAHQSQFIQLYKALRASFPDMLALGAGGCRMCEVCTYPDAPCRRPTEALSSMEAYGLLVSDVCSKNGLAYYYGPGTMTYTGCFLMK